MRGRGSGGVGLRLPSSVRAQRQAGPEVFRLVALLLLVAVFGLANSRFLSPQSLIVMLTGLSYVGIIAVGLTLLIVGGEFDLSMGSVAGLSALTSALLMHDWAVPVPVALLAGLAVGAGVGLTNAIMVLRLRVPSVIATIGMLQAARGMTNVLTEGEIVGPLPPMVEQIGTSVILGVPYSVVAFIVLVVVGELVLRKTVLGRSIYATGGDLEVAKRAGYDTVRIKMTAFVVVGLLSSLAGLFAMAAVQTGQPQIGTGWELYVIAPVVIGGTSVFGGSGRVVGTLLGLLVVQVVESGLVSAGVEVYWQTIAIGVVMVLAVALDLARRWRIRRAG